MVFIVLMLHFDMIKHIVMWKFKESAENAPKQENLVIAKALLDALPMKIPQIQGYEVGINIKDAPGGWDAVLISSFNSEEDLETYRFHPEHLKVVDFVGKVRETGAFVDFII
jgi:hypothetical protein